MAKKVKCKRHPTPTEKRLIELAIAVSDLEVRIREQSVLFDQVRCSLNRVHQRLNKQGK